MGATRWCAIAGLPKRLRVRRRTNSDAPGLASIAIVTVGGPDAAFWSGMTYMLIMPLQIVNGRMMGGRIRQATAASPQP